MATLERSYDNGSDESEIENFDETLVVIDMENGRVLDFQGSRRVTYLYVASSTDYFTFRMRILGGQGAKIEKPLFILRKRTGTTQFHGITYRSPRKAK